MIECDEFSLKIDSNIECALMNIKFIEEKHETTPGHSERWYNQIDALNEFYADLGAAVYEQIKERNGRNSF